MITPYQSNPINKLTSWHDNKVKEATTPPDTYEQRIAQFERDLDTVEQMDGRWPNGYGFPGDKDPRAGSIRVPGVASLQQTSDGFVLNLIRGRLAYNGEVSWATYQIDPTADTIQVSEQHHHDSSHPMPYQENYILHTGSHTMTDYERLEPVGNENPRF